MDIALGILVFFVIAVLLLPRERRDGSKADWITASCYTLAGMLIGGSPLIGMVLADLVGLNGGLKNSLAFAWVGIALSLPLSLLASRLFGRESYEKYWQHLVLLSNMSRRRNIAFVSTFSLFAFLAGMLVLMLG